MKEKLKAHNTAAARPRKTSISDKIRSEFEKAILSGKAAACFKLPHAADFNLITGTAQIDTENEPITTGFIICPFDSRFGNRVFIGIERQTTERLPAAIVGKDASFSLLKPHLPALTHLRETTAEAFKSLTKKGRDYIRTGTFKKLVTSRVKKLPLPENFDLSSVFINLCRLYPTSFISLHYTPQFGLWAGASPELLLSAEESAFKTVSLAGTKTDESAWTKKEIEEQAIVTEYIKNILGAAEAENITAAGPETVKSGHLFHLKTIFTYTMPSPEHAVSLAYKLHPTPAVCGMPTVSALEFLTREEQHPRSLYGGFLGRLNDRGKTDLYVNLRCMQIGRDALLLYAGAGITADSDPDTEWLETEEKLKVVARAVDRFNSTEKA